ncbi:MAG: fluoride efflux transporter CrcB [Ignavibacteriales bacterium CG_4_9_14_3_um_filter_30_11]|nr:MAG: fluoride efflux transporter CrcB [Ignavibacteriales bacterium CG_4_9_14_3_um_filter_30_11]
MLNYFYVGLGAALGGGLRYWVSNVVYKFLPTFFPYGTLIVNALGSFILGFLIFYFDQRELLSQNLKLFLTIGFCGGFTTFSTFSFETIKLFQDSEIYLGMLNILLSIILSFLGIYLAYILSKL